MIKLYNYTEGIRGPIVVGLHVNVSDCKRCSVNEFPDYKYLAVLLLPRLSKYD